MTTTTQAQAVRGASAPATSSINTLPYRDRADDLSMKLDNLMEVVKLMAFTAETRRALARIQASPYSREVLKTVINSAVPFEGLEDNTGDVLHYVAGQLDEFNREFTENLYGLARVSSPSEATTVQEGGAA